MGRFGLLGEHLAHSYSPQIHAFFGDYSYALFEISPDGLGDFLHQGRFDGLNVTIPYKKAVIPYCQELSAAARAIGSVNTLIRRPDGSLYGDNTDDYGFRFLLSRSGVDVRGKKALIFGSGGAAATVLSVLGDLGAGKTVVISRSGPENYDNLHRHSDAAILVNATPLGMYPAVEGMPADAAQFPQAEAALDLVYNPARTRFLLSAEAAGMIAENGLSMLIAQAARASALFTGRPVSDAQVEDVCAALAHRMKNVALIGMPGCGKTTIGRALAAATGRRFIDLDAEIEARTGRRIPEIFEAEGEDAFRAMETTALADFAYLSGCVIATGGGIVTRRENLPLLRANSTAVWIERPDRELPIEGRPLSQRDGVATLRARRLPLYRAFGEYRVTARGVMETATEIKELLHL